MTLNPLAVELNATLEKEAPSVLAMLSDLGKRSYFPKGIISQSQEAKAKAKKFNATIGIALEDGAPMFLPSIRNLVPSLSPQQLFPYAPVSGRPELRDLWRKKQLEENPTLNGKTLGNPIVTSALTHGLSLVSELFVNPGDAILLPDQLWGNYRLSFEIKQQGQIVTFPFFSGSNFNLEAFTEGLQRESENREKLLVILNFPNNPTGYTPTVSEVEGIVQALKAQADKGTKLVVVCDDAYFNLVYDDACIQESIFGHLANVHENILAIRLDGTTKEHFVWGFRVGFISYAAGGSGDLDAIHTALEKKTGGAIRGGISNSPNVSQSLVVEALNNPSFKTEQAQKRDVLCERAKKVREILDDEKFAEAWDAYPFNSGYFHCMKLKTVEAEPLRLHLLDKYGLGVISTSKVDIRVAFSCLEVGDLEEVYSTILQGIKDLEQS